MVCVIVCRTIPIDTDQFILMHISCLVMFGHLCHTHTCLTLLQNADNVMRVSQSINQSMDSACQSHNINTDKVLLYPSNILLRLQ